MSETISALSPSSGIVICVMIVFIIVFLYMAYELYIKEGYAISPLKNQTQEYKQPDLEKRGIGQANQFTGDADMPPYSNKKQGSELIRDLLTGVDHYENNALSGKPEAESFTDNFLAPDETGDLFNDYLIDSQLDSSTLASHQQFVYDQNKLRNAGGTAAHHTIFVPGDPAPWQGLRRPDYNTASSDFNSRMGQEHSVRSSQLREQQRNQLGF